MAPFPCSEAFIIRRRFLLSWDDQGWVNEAIPALRWSGYGEGIVQSSTPNLSASLWLRSSIRLLGDHSIFLDAIPVELSGDTATGNATWTHADVRAGLFAAMNYQGLSTSIHATRMWRQTFTESLDRRNTYWRLVLTVGGYLEP
jgi:hypothetical protein